MNNLIGRIVEVERGNSLIRVTIQVLDNLMQVIILDEGPQAGYQPVIQSACTLIFKETEVSILLGKADHVSIANKMPCNILEIKEEQILSRIKLQHGTLMLYAIISTKELRRMGLREGHHVVALIKENEIILAD